MNGAKAVAFLSVLVVLAPCVFSQDASVSPPTLNFAPQLIDVVGSGGPSQAIILTNTGSANLSITSVLASGGFKQSNNCSTVSPGQACTISVTFNPGTLGGMNGAITIADNAPSSPQVVSLFGVGIAPAQLTPGLLNFGTIPVGSSSSLKTVTLKALSNATVSINQVSVSGNFIQVNNCPTSLRGGQGCTIQVAFRPTVNTLVTGALAVSTVIGTTPLAFSMALKGTGVGTVASQIAIQPASINFGSKGPDLVDSVKAVTLANTSSTSLAINNVSLVGSPNAIGAFPLYKISSNTCPGTLPPGAQCTIEIAFSTTFSRVFPQSYPAALSITDSDPTSPQVIGISGKQVAQLTLKAPTIVFSPQAVGTTTTKTVTLTGNDLQNGLLLDMVTSGGFFASGDLTPCLLQLGATCTLNVSFTPTQSGVVRGAVTLEIYPECNPFPLHQCSDPVVVSLSGTGQ